MAYLYCVAEWAGREEGGAVIRRLSRWTLSVEAAREWAAQWGARAFILRAVVY